MLENVQRRGTKSILNEFTSDYKTRLLSLNLLPLAMLYELNDILFFKSLKKPTAAFHILNYVSFCLHVLLHSLNLSLNLPEPTTSITLTSIVFPVSGTPSPQLTFLLVSILVLKQFFWDHFVNIQYLLFISLLMSVYKCVNTRCVPFK